MMSTLLLGLALAAGPDPATIVGPPANAPPPADQVEAITTAVGKRLRCPVCQGLSVSDSPAESARAMKAEVRELVEQGYDEEQIFAYFEASYGEFIRLEPKVEGFNLLVWALPGGALLVGAGIVARRIGSTRRASPAPAAAPPPPPVDPELLPWIERVRAEVGPPR